MNSKDFYRVLSAIKRTFSKSERYREVLNKAICKKKGVRGGKTYRCSKCKKCFSIKDINIDHISPIVPIGKAARDLDWNTLVNRIYCNTNNLQVLCISCHKKKNKEERKKRNER